MTRLKINSCEKYVKSLGANAVEYIGIAADESGRGKGKCYPLVEWAGLNISAFSIVMRRDIAGRREA